MNYITTLDTNNISKDLMKLLYDEDGINCNNHIKYLTDLKNGFIVNESEKDLKLLNHLDELREKTLKKH